MGRGAELALFNGVLFLLVKIPPGLFIHQIVKGQAGRLQLEAHQFLLCFPREQVRHVHPFCQLGVEFPLGPAFMERLYTFFAQHQKGHAVTDIVGVGHPPFLQMGAGRQHIVGLLAGLAHEHVMDHQEVKLSKGLSKGVGVRHGDQGIAPYDQKGLQFVRDTLGYDRHNTIGALAAPDFEKQRILVRPQGLSFHLQAHVAKGKPGADHPPAGHIDIARDHLKN